MATFNPYHGFSVKVGKFTFHASPSMLTVWEARDGGRRLVAGPEKLGFIPKTKYELEAYAREWSKRDD